jgi:hypothetical protein
VQRLDARQNLGEICARMHSLKDRPVETATCLFELVESFALRVRLIGSARFA